ncbi:pH-response regulator protein palA/rim20 [Microbotryomycetes sp. JL201]|nr:pH-response regulator protein palA/rim20 [Microbotryomycetes sp. JL201]
MAAGVLDHLMAMLPLLKRGAVTSGHRPADSALVPTASFAAPQIDPPSPDLNVDVIQALRDICLAQAQEAFWSKGVMDRLKNGTIAKLAAKVSEFYESAVAKAKQSKGAGGAWPAFAFPDAFISHLTVKQLHFAAVAQYRRSMDDLSANRYGDELGRLQAADAFVKRAMAVPKKGIADSVLKDLKARRSLASTVTDNKVRATKDNDLIYLEAVTPLSALPRIVPAVMAKTVTPDVVMNPIAQLQAHSLDGLGRPLFLSLVPFEVHQGCELYADRRAELFKSDLTGRQEQLDKEQARMLSQLGLPASIEAVMQPMGLPASLIDRSKEVQREGGVEKLRSMLQDVRRVARINHKLLSEAQSTLAREQEEDSKLRTQHGTDRWTRLPSDIAGAQLRAQVDNFANILDAAGESDGVVRTKFGSHEHRFQLLSSDGSTLESAIPRLEDPARQSPDSSQQAATLRQVRRLLDELSDIRLQRQVIADEAKRTAAAENIRPRLVAEAERLSAKIHAEDGSGTKLELHMFEDMFMRELRKYEGFVERMQENANRQDDLLHQIKSANDGFLQARKRDPALAKREKALQDLDSAFTMFCEVLQNLQEGLNFYSDLSKLLGELGEACKQWAIARSNEAQELVQGILASGMSNVRVANVNEPGVWQPGGEIRFG